LKQYGVVIQKVSITEIQLENEKNEVKRIKAERVTLKKELKELGVGGGQGAGEAKGKFEGAGGGAERAE